MQPGAVHGLPSGGGTRPTARIWPDVGPDTGPESRSPSRRPKRSLDTGPDPVEIGPDGNPSEAGASGAPATAGWETRAMTRSRRPHVSQ